MSVSPERTALVRNFLFKGLADEILDKVSSLGVTREYPAGHRLFCKGDAGDRLYAVVSGRVEITVDKEDGTPFTLNTLEAGSTFGEIALLDEMPRTADATVSADSRLFVIERPVFMEFLRSEPALFEHIMRLLCERVRWVSNLVEERNRSETQLRKLNSAVEHSPSVVLITDTEGTVEYVNPKFTALTGWSADEVIGGKARVLKSGEMPEEVYADLWRTVSAGGEWRGDLLNRKKNGEQYWESCCIAPIFDRDGAISHYVAVNEDITERKRLEEELRRLATTDGLTGVSNRRHFMAAAEKEIARSRRNGRPLSVLMLDIDHFKRINDTHGHGIGDDALRAMSGALRDQFRVIDQVGRLGGEEFAVLLPETDLEHAAAAAERLRKAVAALVVEDPELGAFGFTCSLGVAQYQGEEEMERLLQRADQALYEAKHGGRNRVVASS